MGDLASGELLLAGGVRRAGCGRGSCRRPICEYLWYDPSVPAVPAHRDPCVLPGPGAARRPHGLGRRRHAGVVQGESGRRPHGVGDLGEAPGGAGLGDPEPGAPPPGLRLVRAASRTGRSSPSTRATATASGRRTTICCWWTARGTRTRTATTSTRTVPTNDRPGSAMCWRTPRAAGRTPPRRSPRCTTPGSGVRRLDRTLVFTPSGRLVLLDLAEVGGQEREWTFLLQTDRPDGAQPRRQPADQVGAATARVTAVRPGRRLGRLRGHRGRGQSDVQHPGAASDPHPAHVARRRRPGPAKGCSSRPSRRTADAGRRAGRVRGGARRRLRGQREDGAPVPRRAAHPYAGGGSRRADAAAVLLGAGHTPYVVRRTRLVLDGRVLLDVPSRTQERSADRCRRSPARRAPVGWPTLLRRLEFVAYPAAAGAAFAVLSLGVVTWLPALAAMAHALQRWRAEGTAAVFANTFAAFPPLLARAVAARAAVHGVAAVVLTANIVHLLGRSEPLDVRRARRPGGHRRCRS